MNKDEEKINLKNAKMKETRIERENNILSNFYHILLLKREIPVILSQDMKET